MRLASTTFFLMLILAVGVASSAESEFLKNGVTAHRGFSERYPENTLRAFRAGIEAGADWLECDVYKTKDEQLVVIHDSTTKRIGDRDVCVNDASYIELQTIDAAYGFRKKNKLSLEQCPREQIPLLSEVIELVRKQRKTRLSIQPKDKFATAEAMELIERQGAASWVGFNDGDVNKMRQVKKYDPGIPVFWDRGEKNKIDEDVRIARQYGFESVVIHWKGMTEQKVAALHAAGLQVGAWTVNDATQMRRLLQMGVDRLYTDNPMLLLEMKKQARNGARQCGNMNMQRCN